MPTLFFRKNVLQALLCALLGIVGILPVTARADKLDDNLQTVWESLWDQRGTPRQLVRWEQTLTYSVSGVDAEQHSKQIHRAMAEAAKWTKLEVTEINLNNDAKTAAALQFEVVKNDLLPDSMPCVTQPTWSNWTLTKAVVKMQSKGAWRCIFHEVMHAMGIPGHPSGKTVLSYFPYRRDEFMALDQLMLKAWYDPAMPKGATPLEALVVLASAVSQQSDLDISADQAIERTQAFSLRAVSDLKALALGKGEIPTIVQRSGRASTTHIEAARPLAAYFLGRAYSRGTIVNLDAAAATDWYRLSAKGGYSAGQVMLARALIKGVGTDINPSAAHGWLSIAAKSNTVALKELELLEKSMSAEQLAAAKLLPLPALELK